MILACSHIKKAFGVDRILDDITFHIEEGEHVGVVGINGAGKTTLLRIIMNEMPADEGQITCQKGASIGYLSQHIDISSERSIFDEVLTTCQDLIDRESNLREMEEKMASLPHDELDSFMADYQNKMDQFKELGGYSYRGEVTAVIRGLGFSDQEFDKKLNELSGGQKTRVALAKLLIGKPDILLLDEPTNHLDIGAIEWLEDYLKSYKGAVLIVSHDRYFLDRIVTKIVEIENRISTVYRGSYSEYSKKKEEQRAIYLKHYFEQQKMIKHEEEVINTYRSFKTEAAIIKAKSREKRLAMVERLEKPMEIRADMKFSIEPAKESGKDVLMVTGFKKAYDDKLLFENLDFDIKKGERVAVIGDNGTGKTTFLKLLNNVLEPDEGDFRLGSNVSIGYYDQEQQNMDEENTLFDEIGDAYPDMTNTKIRNVLGAFLFTDDDVFKRIKDLSGGERGRVSLAKLMLSEANFLILDEPTNHLDLNSKEILETALNNYTGTVLFVSHDRYFINRTATRIVELKDKNFNIYLGNYDYYLEKSRASKEEEIKVLKAESTTSSDKSGKADYARQKEEAAAKKKIERAIKKCEDSIDILEGELKKVLENLADPEIAANSAKLNEWTKKQSEIMEKLEPLYSEWEELTNQI